MLDFRDKAGLAGEGFPDMTGEVHGTGAFLRDGDRVFHTYSTYGRARSRSVAPTNTWT